MRLARAARPALIAGALLASALALAPTPSRAQAPGQEPSASHLTAARELIVVAGTAGTLDRIVPALVDEMRRQGVTRPELAKDLDEVLKGLAPEVEQQRQQAYLIASRVYARVLTETEIRDAIAFFKSPSGARYVRAQPELTDGVINSVTSWTQLAAEYIQTRVRAEMLKRGHSM